MKRQEDERLAAKKPKESKPKKSKENVAEFLESLESNEPGEKTNHEKGLEKQLIDDGVLND